MSINGFSSDLREDLGSRNYSLFNLIWKKMVNGKNVLISSLNSRLFTMQRVANHLQRSKLVRLAHALWTSKLRYGLQLCSNVRISEEETKNVHNEKA